MSNKSIDLSKDKIRYLAIGDSISEGYNSLYNFGFPGNLRIEKDKKIISGMSFPAILTHMLNDLNHDCVESFENFAISGTRIVDWLYFLGIEPEKYNFGNSAYQIKKTMNIDAKKDNPQKNRCLKQFGLFGKKSESDFDTLKNEIKKANFITITIGANDWLYNFPFLEIVAFRRGSITRQDFDQKIHEGNQELLNGLTKIIDKIKLLNPKANVVILNYNKTMPWLFQSINDKLKNGKNINKIDMFHYIDLMNETIMIAAEKMGINFINAENTEYWIENNQKLSQVFYDIHPTYYGYKKMAQEIFLKTSLSNNFYQQNLKEIIQILPNINKAYFESDFKKFSNIFDFSKLNISDEDIIINSKILDKKLFWSDNSYEKAYLNLRKTFSISKNFIVKKEHMSTNVKSILGALFLIIEENHLDPENYISKILSNESYIETFMFYFSKSEYVDIIVNQVNQELQNNDKKIDLKYFEEIIFSKLFNLTNLLKLFDAFNSQISKNKDFKFLKTFECALSSLILNINKNIKYKKIISDNIKDIAIKSFSKKFSSIKPHLLVILIDDFLDTKVEIIVTTLIEYYFKNLRNIKNIDLFLVNFIKNFFNKISLKIMLENIVDKNEVKYVLSEIILNILKIKNYTKKDIKVFDDFLKLLISKIEKENLIIDSIIEIIIKLTDNNNDKNDQWNIIYNFIEHSNLWSVLKVKKMNNMWNGEKDIFVVADVINLLFKKSSISSSGFYGILSKIENPKIIKNSKIISLFNNTIDFIDKVKKIENFYVVFSNTLYNSFLEFKKLNPEIPNEDNPYYKSFYRFIVSSLWIGYRLFQKDFAFNIFINFKRGILKKLPTISSQIYTLAMDNSNDPQREEVLDYIFQDSFKQDETTYNEAKSVLWYIQTCDLDPIDFSTEKDKKNIIFQSLKNGKWKK